MSGGTPVCRVDDVAPGEKRRVLVGRKPIVLCRTASGEFYAVSDNCPHQGASLCNGVLGGTTVSDQPGMYSWRDGEVLRCPWHAWEFDVTTGRSLCGEDRYRLATYPVSVVEGEVVVGARAPSAGRA
jgi:3-phenylpropionate/trans-cinnamate dioxygenase ferredoxin subunit